MHFAQRQEHRATGRIEKGRDQGEAGDADDLNKVCRVPEQSDRHQHQTEGDKPASEPQQHRVNHMAGGIPAVCTDFAHEELRKAEAADTLKQHQPSNGECVGAEQLRAGHARDDDEQDPAGNQR